MPFCPRCNTQQEQDLDLCPTCATPLEEKNLVGTVLDDRFHILSCLGAGGVGVVYHARNAEGREVALKLLHTAHTGDRELRHRLEREARMMTDTSGHPNIASVTEVGAIEGRPFFVMEYIKGRSLAWHMARSKLTPSDGVIIALEVLDALHHAHTLGIIHRDLKPENVMILGDPGQALKVKLLDFGTAQSVKPGAPGSSVLTQAGIVFGSPSYVSPEQLRKQPLDPRTDLYSLGVVLYELVSGKRPFEGQTTFELLRAHLTTPPPPPRLLNPTLSPELETVVLKALAKDREERFQTARELEEALRQVPEAAE